MGRRLGSERAAPAAACRARAPPRSYPPPPPPLPLPPAPPRPGATGGQEGRERSGWGEGVPRQPPPAGMARSYRCCRMGASMGARLLAGRSIGRRSGTRECGTPLRPNKRGAERGAALQHVRVGGLGALGLARQSGLG
eukprot:scaffold40283_cov65-Phaeocystis_antarctica.AAC.4